jgi:hypothetical protein
MSLLSVSVDLQGLDDEVEFIAARRAAWGDNEALAAWKASMSPEELAAHEQRVDEQTRKVVEQFLGKMPN